MKLIMFAFFIFSSEGIQSGFLIFIQGQKKKIKENEEKGEKEKKENIEHR